MLTPGFAGGFISVNNFLYNLYMANLLRLLIISVIFMAGVIIGNVYLPQKNFDQKSIVVPQKPKASFNIDNVPQIDTVLKEADKYKNILISSGQDQEEIIGFENNFKNFNSFIGKLLSYLRFLFIYSY